MKSLVILPHRLTWPLLNEYTKWLGEFPIQDPLSKAFKEEMQDRVTTIIASL